MWALVLGVTIFIGGMLIVVYEIWQDSRRL